MIKCCEEHVDVAIDTIVDEYEVAPKIDKISVDNYPELFTTCEYCEKNAVYIVSN
ncbi:CxxH/CxxC protein [Calidifontibacillus oryziterrae]|uniref:CxxH/CxxC protein n=1 Tax=Calidifontibacillus oryziterrae TaxID=1191699 RepID=UPI000311F915|nr:CxxH/CxxC protein [Calidifontibacillus oryziterrae]